MSRPLPENLSAQKFDRIFLRFGSRRIWKLQEMRDITVNTPMSTAKIRVKCVIDAG